MINKKGSGKGIIIFLIILIVVLLVWGFIGGQQAKSIGVTCDIGIGESLCWKWHTNAIGQVQEFVKDTGNSIKELSE